MLLIDHNYQINMLKISRLWYYFPTLNLRINVEINLLKYLVAPPIITTVESTGVFMYICKFVEVFLSKTFPSLAIGI